MIVIEVLNYFLLFGAGVLVSYHLLISLFAFRVNSNDDRKTIKSRRFAVILFTQGEGEVLSRSLYSLSGLVYPKNKYDLFVVAQSYAEGILEMAEKMGAQIMVPPKEKLQKETQNILPWVFEQIVLKEQNYDAIVVFDSDGLVSGNYLDVMNYYLEQGCEIIQGAYNNLRLTKKWVEQIREINFLIDHNIYPIGRKGIGLGVNIRSNGTCFSTSLLHAFPWKIGGHQNSTEYGLSLRLDDIEIDFAPEALFYTEISNRRKSQGNSQHDIRPNRYQFIKNYVSEIVSKTFKRKSLKYFDILVDLFFPRFRNVMFFVVLMGIITGIIWWMGGIATAPLLAWLVITGGVEINVFLSSVKMDRKNKILETAIYIPVNFYIIGQEVITQFFGKEDSVGSVERKNNRITVLDKNHPVQ